MPICALIWLSDLAWGNFYLCGFNLNIFDYSYFKDIAKQVDVGQKTVLKKIKIKKYF